MSKVFGETGFWAAGFRPVLQNVPPGRGTYLISLQSFLSWPPVDLGFGGSYLRRDISPSTRDPVRPSLGWCET